MVRNRLFQNIRKNKLGQSTVEYIMLLAVMTTIILTILKSDTFQNVFGKDSEFFSRLGKMVEFSYRHTHMGTLEDRNGDTYNYGGNSVEHKSYRRNDGTSRIFVSLEKYPSN